MVVEFLGRAYRILRPGLRWVCPRLMHKRLLVITSEQSLLLFPERRYPNGIHIDLKGGGKTELVEPRVWVQVEGAGTQGDEEESILKIAYAIDDWIIAIQEAFEDALKTCLNNLTVEGVLSATHESDKDSWWDAVKSRFVRLEDTVKSYGFVVKRLTISDFNWDEEVVKTRQKIFEEERSIRLAELSVLAAEHEVKQRAMELGQLIEIVMERLIKSGCDKEKARETAVQVVTYQLGAKFGIIKDIRTSDGASAIGSTASAYLTDLANRLVGNNKERREE